MQVFKAYFKIIKRHFVGIMIYFVIFVAIALIITSALGGSSKSAEAFTQTKSYIAFYNMDQDSVLVEGLKDHLSKNATFVNIPDDTQRIQDALFYGQIVYVLRVPKGFTQDFLSGKSDITLDKMTASGSISSVYMDSLVNKYLNTATLYAKTVPGITETQIVQNVDKDLAVQTDVALNTYAKPSGTGNMSYYFQYFAYCILAVMIMGVTSFMMVFNEPELRNRNLCSPLKPSKVNLQIVLGNATFGFVVWAVLCAVVLLLNKGTMDTGTVLLCLNALAFTVVGLAIGFLAGKFIKSHPVQAAVTNVISLGICFISGVFVEQELLGKSVLTIASFTPGYWYVKAVNDIRNMVVFNAQNITPVIYSILIQLGFALALIIIALVVTKQKNTSKAAA